LEALLKKGTIKLQPIMAQSRRIVSRTLKIPVQVLIRLPTALSVLWSRHFLQQGREFRIAKLLDDY
jgi:hypothetical protein